MQLSGDYSKRVTAESSARKRGEVAGTRTDDKTAREGGMGRTKVQSRAAHLARLFGTRGMGLGRERYGRGNRWHARHERREYSRRLGRFRRLVWRPNDDGEWPGNHKDTKTQSGGCAAGMANGRNAKGTKERPRRPRATGGWQGQAAAQQSMWPEGAEATEGTKRPHPLAPSPRAERGDGPETRRDSGVTRPKADPVLVCLGRGRRDCGTRGRSGGVRSRGRSWPPRGTRGRVR